MRLQMSRSRRIAVTMRLGACDGGCAVARRDELNQVIGKLIGGGRAEAGSSVPARSSAEARHAGEGVVTTRYIEQRRGEVALSLTDVVQRGVDEAEVLSCPLIDHRQDSRPLRRSGAGAAEQIKSGREPRNIEIRE